MIELVIKVILAYLVGSVIGSLLVGRILGGGDIRAEGSGNAGGTNALRTRGKLFALWVMIVDVGKGILAVAVIAPLAIPLVPEAAFHPEWIAVACGIAVVLGHVWPVFYGFRGGKGVATYIGALGVLAWPALVMAFMMFAVVLMLTGYVSLGSMIATAAVALYLLFVTGVGPLFIFGVVMALFILFTHRSNIARLRDGTENRFEKAMLLHRMLGL
jgi:glycerol-3-phosphate acyltransferase PlsY